MAFRISEAGGRTPGPFALGLDVGIFGLRVLGFRV